MQKGFKVFIVGKFLDHYLVSQLQEDALERVYQGALRGQVDHLELSRKIGR